MPDISPYGVTQNADAARITANQIVGDPVGLTIGDAITARRRCGPPPPTSASAQRARQEQHLRAHWCWHGSVRVPHAEGAVTSSSSVTPSVFSLTWTKSANAPLDGYLQEGVTAALSDGEPLAFFESVWPVVTDTATIDIPAGCNVQQITALIDGVTRVRLMQIAVELAEDNFVSGSAATMPIYYTIWGNQITLWPHYAGDPRDFTLRGYRLEHDWIADGASAEVDADPRLHMLLVHYAIALAYAQQEDEVLEDVTWRWQSSYPRRPQRHHPATTVHHPQRWDAVPRLQPVRNLPA
jgi:hypothetical protein